MDPPAKLFPEVHAWCNRGRPQQGSVEGRTRSSTLAPPKPASIKARILRGQFQRSVSRCCILIQSIVYSSNFIITVQVSELDVQKWYIIFRNTKFPTSLFQSKYLKKSSVDV